MSPSPEGSGRFSQAASPWSYDIYLQPRQLFKSTKPIKLPFPLSQGESVQHGNSKGSEHANGAGTEIMTSTGNIPTILEALGKRREKKKPKTKL